MESLGRKKSDEVTESSEIFCSSEFLKCFSIFFCFCFFNIILLPYIIEQEMLFKLQIIARLFCNDCNEVMNFIVFSFFFFTIFFF